MVCASTSFADAVAKSKFAGGGNQASVMSGATFE